MSFCPNKSSKEYQALVSQLGEANAYNAWFEKNKALLSDNHKPLRRVDNNVLAGLLKNNFVYDIDSLKVILEKTNDLFTIRLLDLFKSDKQFIIDNSIKYYGVFTLTDNSIKINVKKHIEDNPSNYNIVDTIIHELVHRFMFMGVQLRSNTDLKTLFEDAKILYKGNNKYAFLDIHEFVSEVMSNKVFQRELKKIPYKNSNVFNKFVDYLLSVLNIKKDNLLSEAITRIIEFNTDRLNTYSLFDKEFKIEAEENFTTVEPSIPSIEEARSLISGISFNLQLKEFPTFENEMADIRKTYTVFQGLPMEKLMSIARTINKKYKTVKASIVKAASGDYNDYTLTFSKSYMNKALNKENIKKLSKLFPKTQISYITKEQANIILGDESHKAASFIMNNTVYVIEDRVNDETLIEEFLHPFIEYVYQNNKPLFESLYQDAKNDTKLFKDISKRYSGFKVLDKQKELVTQKLAFLLNQNYLSKEPNTIEGITTDLKKLFKEVVKFFSKWLGGTVLNVEELPSNMDLGQLANILNTDGLEAPVEYLFNPTFSLIDDLSKQSKDENIKIVGDNYEDGAGNKYNRLTEWVRNTFSKTSGKSTYDFAKYKAEGMFKISEKTVENGVEKIKLPDGKLVTLDELINSIVVDFETSKAYGTLAHAIIERAIKKINNEDTTAISAKIKELSEGTDKTLPIELYKLDWIEKNIKLILNISGINITQEGIDQAKKDKVLSELPYVLKQLGIGTTMDGVIEHADGTLSIKDWKTGRLLSDEFTSELLTEFGSQLEDIHDSKLDRAKLEVVLRALMIKYNNPSAKFRQLSIEYLNKNTLVESYNINLESYLNFLESYFKAKQPDIYKDLKEKNLFDLYSYGATIPEDTEKVFQEKQETIELLDEQIEITTNSISKEKRIDVKDALKYKLLKLTQQRIAAEQTLPGSLTEEKNEISWFKRHFGNLSSVSDPVIRIFKNLLDKARMAFNVEYNELVKEHDLIHDKLMKDFNPNWKNLGLKYKTSNNSGLYDFLWVKKDKGSNIGYYKITKDDAEFKNLTPTQQEYVTFLETKMQSLYSEVAKSIVAKDFNGRPLTNAEFNNQPLKLDNDFMPRVYKSKEEFIIESGLFAGLKADLSYSKFKHKFLKSEFYAKDAIEVIPFKHMGSDAIIGSQLHSFNAELAFKQFSKNLLRKKHMDKIHAIGVGISTNFFNQGKARNADFIKDRLISDVLGLKKETVYSVKGFNIMKGNDKLEIDVDKLFDYVRAFTTAGTMWLKPFAGLRNGVYTLMTNHKNSIIGSVSKKLGIPPEDLNFTESDMMKADALWMGMKADVLSGKGNQNKILLLLKEFNYLPESYDYRVHPDSITSTSNKMLNSDYLYIFHSTFEDWGTGSIFTALLLHNKNPKTGKSLLDSYEVEDGQLKWKGDIRGKRADGSLIEGITYEELNKFKKASAAIHGNYREDEKGAIELYAVGRLMMQFKRFVPQQLMNLFQGKQLSDAYGKFVELKDAKGNAAVDKDGISIYEWRPEVIEGKYRLLFGHLLNVMRIGTGAYKFENLSPRQKQDLISSYYTIASSVILTALGSLMFSDDDDDKWLALAYYKIARDMSEGMHPIDMLENFQQQSVSGYKFFKMSKAIGEIFMSVSTGEKNKYGKYKGTNELAKIIPPFSTLYDIDKAFNRTKSGKNIGLDPTGIVNWGDADWSDF